MVYQPIWVAVADKLSGLAFFRQGFDSFDAVGWITKDPANLFNTFVGDPIKPVLQLFIRAELSVNPGLPVPPTPAPARSVQSAPGRPGNKISGLQAATRQQ